MQQHIMHARDTRVELLRRETPQFISPDMRPANSPDLDPVWGMMQNREYGRVAAALVETWAEFQQSVVDDAPDHCRERTTETTC